MPKPPRNLPGDKGQGGAVVAREWARAMRPWLSLVLEMIRITKNW
jgi:hypothetical protein